MTRIGWGFFLIVLAGCSQLPVENGSTSSGTIKTRGVYTTLAKPGQELDMSGGEYLQCRSFSGQAPAAVIMGYGDSDGHVNYGQPYDLQLVESASGTIMETYTGQIYHGKAAIMDLAIRKTGQYRLVLTINGSPADTWDFSVTRNAPADRHPGEAATAYAQGDFAVAIEDEALDAFKSYNDSLIWLLNREIQKELKEHPSLDDFAQMPPGHVLVQFDLKASGQVASPRILENTLSEALGRFFLGVLQNGAPYKSWPAEARAAVGVDSRTLRVNFYYN